MTVSMFKVTLFNYDLSYTIEILNKFKPTLLKYSKDLIPYMTSQLEVKHVCLGVKLELFYTFLGKIMFKEAF